MYATNRGFYTNNALRDVIYTRVLVSKPLSKQDQHTVAAAFLAFAAVAIIFGVFCCPKIAPHTFHQVGKSGKIASCVFIALSATGCLYCVTVVIIERKRARQGHTAESPFDSPKTHAPSHKQEASTFVENGFPPEEECGQLKAKWPLFSDAVALSANSGVSLREPDDGTGLGSLELPFEEL